MSRISSTNQANIGCTLENIAATFYVIEGNVSTILGQDIANISVLLVIADRRCSLLRYYDFINV